MKRTVRNLAMMLALLLAALGLSGCGGNKADAEEPTPLAFADAVSIDALRALNGKRVSIIGYMATLSPVSGQFLYLMNLPYQSCPFCVPNTTQLANTMAVYAPDGKTFDYTDQAIQVTGTLEMGDYTDAFGYQYAYRIRDAAFAAVDLSTLSEDYLLWQTVAADGVVAEINGMLDYLHFLCQWTDYQSSAVDENGEVYAFNLYPGDVEQFLADEGLNGYARQHAPEYFPSLAARVRALSPELEDLAALVERAQQVAVEAEAELQSGAFSYDAAADAYTLNRSEELYAQWYAVYADFSQWLTQWEV